MTTSKSNEVDKSGSEIKSSAKDISENLEGPSVATRIWIILLKWLTCCDVDLSRPQMTAQLVANLQSAIQKSLVLGRTASVASNARALIELCGLGVDRKQKYKQWFT